MPLDAFAQKFDPARVSSGQFADDNDITLFVHIPKTAGMSVGKALQSSFDKFHGVAWNKPRASFNKLTQKACYLRTTRNLRQVLMGHFTADEVAVWRGHGLPVKCAAIIREPVARVVSHYNYNGSDAHPNHEQFLEKHPTLESFARALPYDFQINWLVGPPYSFEHTLEKLIRDYSFLGVTEHLPASLAHFERSHGLENMQEHRINVGQTTVSQDGISEEVRDIVTARSQNDIALHKLLNGFYE